MDTSRIVWRKSSRSGDGPNCVEVGVWHKSSFSGAGQNCIEVGVWNKSTLSGNGQDCVEVALADTRQTEPGPDAAPLVLVRDSKDADGPVLAFSYDEWDAFLCSIKGDNFDDLAMPYEV
ncbi:DUF397 domain-containing protein [Streptosporangium sp. NBC_01495]|uniref:DUF397 domain-containing protein n=1 Tax=Streptosporangium sp. NBC_01495 TaxID=2903899 RepID=UPI002E313C07|nr:DUF397 domain-containing protein [Streptosporangium sp. NBC_01495]